MEQPNASPHATAIPSTGRKLVVVGIGVMFAIHTFLVTVWVMPANPFRDAVGGQNLMSYINNGILPFEQSWSVFAPTPRRGGENVKVRAYIGEPGSKTGRVTNWYDVTADEDQRIKYLVNPARIHSATRRLGGNINSSVAQFSPQQRTVIGASFITTPRTELKKMLLADNTKGLAGQINIGSYLDNDEMLTRFGTMYATARWGKGVTAVEFKVGHRSVPNYSKRNDIDFKDVPFTYYDIGVRKAIPGNADAQAAFDGYVRKAPEESATKGGS
ncbi:DUF5819 family protein [Aeromicrobium sp.]|uniref:DUF5819 family protein n=1 Tax=Aeromicrobium sp. TaxID=1871063 RepID=UPI003C6EDC1B